MFSIGPLKRFWGVAMSDFDFTPLSIHPTNIGGVADASVALHQQEIVRFMIDNDE